MGKKYNRGYVDGHERGHRQIKELHIRMEQEISRQGEKTDHAVGYLEGFQAGKAHAHKFPVDMEPQKEGDRAGQVIFDEIQPGSPPG